MRSRLPASLLKLTLPPTPTFTITKFGRTSHAGTLRFEASGLVSPVGQAVMNVAADGLTAVTFNTTAVTPAAGTPPTPVTVISRVCPAPIRPAGPGTDRESHTLKGERGVNLAPTTGAATVMVISAVTASGLTPFVARTAKVNGPVVVGVPDRTPVVASRLNPGGRAPLATANVGAGYPLAENPYGA